MRLWICVFAMMASLGAAQEQQKAKPEGKRQAARAEKKTPPASKFSIPSDAEQIAPGTWKHQADGKTWIYRETPFGIARFEEKDGVKPEPKNVKPEPVRAFDDGDYVRFERNGPFGVYKWRSRKSELSDAERRAWEESKSAKNAQEQ